MKSLSLFILLGLLLAAMPRVGASPTSSPSKSTPSPTPTRSTPRPTPTATRTQTVKPTPTPKPAPTHAPKVTPSPSKRPTRTPSPTSKPTRTPSPSPTARAHSPSPSPSVHATSTPTPQAGQISLYLDARSLGTYPAMYSGQVLLVPIRAARVLSCQVDGARVRRPNGTTVEFSAGSNACTVRERSGSTRRIPMSAAAAWGTGGELFVPLSALVDSSASLHVSGARAEIRTH